MTPLITRRLQSVFFSFRKASKLLYDIVSVAQITATWDILCIHVFAKARFEYMPLPPYFEIDCFCQAIEHRLWVSTPHIRYYTMVVDPGLHRV